MRRRCRCRHPEHYLPLLYIAGARREDDTLSILTDGIELALDQHAVVRLCPLGQSPC